MSYTIPTEWESRVIIRDGCWLWTGARNAKGYGSISNGNGSSDLVHRVSYSRLIGPIPNGLQIDHLCMVPACCNPAHLEAVTGAENIRRRYASMTHCKSGHELSAANTNIHRRSNGVTTRECRTCHRERMREWRAAKKLAA